MFSMWSSFRGWKYADWLVPAYQQFPQLELGRDPLVYRREEEWSAFISVNIKPLNLVTTNKKL